MKTLIGALALLGLSTAVALADDAPADPPPSADPVEDCSKLEGEAKTTCEAKQAAEAKPEEKGGKAGKLEKSDDNRMEKFDDE